MCEKTSNPSRNYGIDTLRIVSMFMIVVYHTVGHGLNVWTYPNTFTSTYLVVSVLEIITVCAVNCYALISGYVGVYSKWRISNIARLWLQVLFYSVSISTLFKIIRPESVSNKDWLLSFFPIISNQYWYFTGYFILFLFMPLLNLAINNAKKRQLVLFFVFLFFFVSILSPVYNKVIGGDVFYLKGGFSAWWLIILYLLGGFIRKFEVFSRIKNLYLSIAFIASTLITYASKIALYFISMGWLKKNLLGGIFGTYTSISVLVSAVTLLLLFCRMNVNLICKKIVGFLSPLSFGVYLIHENQYSVPNVFGLIRNYPANGIYSTLLLIIVSSVTIFSCCILIELLRSYLFKILKIKSTLEKAEIKFHLIIDSYFNR